jgi:ribonucleoside-diphosphate reductase alpha chain
MDKKTYTYDEVLKASTEYFNGNELSAKVFSDKYPLNKKGDYFELTPDDMHDRLSSEFARIDSEKYGLDYDERFSIYRDASNKFARVIAQGSIMSAVGNLYTAMSASNCVAIDSPSDSIEGIFGTGTDMAQLFKRRCGVGVDISPLRPEGFEVSNAAKTSTGSWSFANFYSEVTKVIGQNSRRGALMVTMDIHHPDIESFAKAKLDKSKVTGANLSIRLSDEFMKALVNNEDYEQRWPCEGEPKFINKVSAKKVWDVITHCATNCGCPGLMFWDNICKNLPAHCYPQYKTLTTNPCSEIPLSGYDSCRLISINLTGYVRDPFEKDSYFDFKSFEKDVCTATQMLDNLVDLEIELIDKIIAKCDTKNERELWRKLQVSGKNGRRVGLGTHGLADTLAQLNVKYDSVEAQYATDYIYKKLRNTAYAYSVELAKVRGPFPDFDWSKEKDCPFLKRLPFKLYNAIRDYGRRNIALLTQAPTGSVSMISKCGSFDSFNISSGMEPVFRNVLYRKKKINAGDNSVPVDFVDEFGDKWQEFKVNHSNVTNYLSKFNKKINELPDFFVTADSIKWKSRIALQSVIQNYIDHAISACLAKDNHLVHTSNGLVYIEDIISDQKKKGFCKPTIKANVVNHNNQAVPINEGYYNGSSPCIKISFSGGRNIIGTHNHKLLILGNNYDFEWKKIKDINTDDFVVGRMGMECFGDSSVTFATALGKFETNISGGNTKQIKLPRKMNNRIARLLGYLASDGSIGENGISLSQLNNNVVNDFVDIIKTEFGIDSYICKDKRCDNLVSVQVNSRILRDFIKYLGLEGKCYEKVVPKAIFKCAGRQQTAEFIKGITLDGFVSDGKVGVMSSTSLKLLRELQILLDQFGINAGIVKCSNDGVLKIFPNSGKSYLTRSCWMLYCGLNESQKFVNMIGFAEERKVKEVQNKLRRPSRKSVVGHIPNYGIRERVKTELMPALRASKLYDMCHSFSTPSKNHMDITRDSLLVMADLGLNVKDYLIDETYIFRKVLSCEDVGERDTFDLHIKNGNSYTVNNIISHNTINLPRGTKSELVSEIYLEAWKKGLKGITVYIEGSKDGVLVSEEEKDILGRPTFIKSSQSPKRPKELQCEIHHSTVVGVKWTILIGLLKGVPYEIFMGKASNFNIPNKVKTGKIVKVKKGRYNLLANNNDMIIKNIIKISDNEEGAWVTRMMSMSLRHGIPVEYLVEQLSKDGSVVDINNVLSRLLRRYMKKRVSEGETCPDCGLSEIIYSEGCKKCSCGYSKCG